MALNHSHLAKKSPMPLRTAWCIYQESPCTFCKPLSKVSFDRLDDLDLSVVTRQVQ